MLVFAQVSDFHLDGSERNAERAARVVAHLADLSRPLDAILLTGDIADHGLPAEYEEAARVLAAAPQPVLTCPGNHDVRAAYREVLRHKLPSADPINEVHDVNGVLFAMCDSTVPGEPGGYLDEETLVWLDGVLTLGAPTIICFHHPPVLLHQPVLDAIRQLGEHRLAEVVRNHPNVAALLCGHAHTAAATTFAGRPLVVAPGVVSTLRLPWEDADVLDYDLPPALAFHVLDDDGRLTTHYRVVP